MKYKVGDKIKSKMNYLDRLTKNKIYTITDIVFDGVWIYDDNNERVSISIGDLKHYFDLIEEKNIIYDHNVVKGDSVKHIRFDELGEGKVLEIISENSRKVEWENKPSFWVNGGINPCLMNKKEIYKIEEKKDKCFSCSQSHPITYRTCVIFNSSVNCPYGIK